MAKRKTTRRTTKASTSKAKRKAKAKTTHKPTAKKPTSVNPPGFNTVSVHLSVDNAARAIAFYQNAFGARPRNIMTMPDGRVMHAELRIGDSTVMLADDMPQAPVKSPRVAGTTTNVLHLFVKNVDQVWEKTTRAGAEVIMPLGDQFWEQRYGQVKDPFGHVWALAQPIKLSKREIETKRREMMEGMAAASRPRTPPGNGGREWELTV